VVAANVDLDKYRASIQKQLEMPLARLLPLKYEKVVLAEQRARVDYGERCLWGASIVMSVVGLTQRVRPDVSVPELAKVVDPLEAEWWKLHDLLEEIRATWPDDERINYDSDRPARRRAAYDEVTRKLAKAGVMQEVTPYAAEEQARTDEWPRIRYDLEVWYAREMGWLRVRDPFTGEWHEIPSKEAPYSWRREAHDRKAKAKLERGG
jgi:hypothetical protein